MRSFEDRSQPGTRGTSGGDLCGVRYRFSSTRVLVGLAACVLLGPAGLGHASLQARASSELAAESHQGQAEDRIPWEEPLEPFQLTTFSGRPFAWPADAKGRLTVLAFVGTECPLAKLYVHRLKQYESEFSKRGVTFLAVDSNSQDSLLEMQAFARRMELPFPFLKDAGGDLADRVGATRTPEVFVLDSERRVRYAGRIDDQYGVGFSRPAPDREDLRLAIEQLLAEEDVAVRRTTPAGCLIGRVPDPQGVSSVTYRQQISRLLQAHCVECHREGQIGPFPLDNYADAAGWADMLVEVVEQGRMPPWNADPQHGDFANERGMTSAERELLKAWANAGAPEGQAGELPEPRDYVEGWRLPRKPDLVIEMSPKPFPVPAEGVVEYQYFVVDPGFTEDKWVQASEVIPGDPSVVHHSIVFIRSPDGPSIDNVGWVGGYVPGQNPSVLAKGLARRIPAGARFVFQMHYTPSGQATTDLSKIGLCFVAAEDVQQEVMTVPAVERDFEIPPQASDYLVESSIEGFPAGSELLGITPHMHVRGKSYQVTLQRGAEDSPQPLLAVPQYDFNWQHSYRFLEPVELRPEMKLRSYYYFDNSSENLANPDPEAYVRWGDQTWQEMAVAFFDVALPPGRTAEELFLRDQRKRIDATKAALEKAAQFISRFDKNDDGQLRRFEVSESFATFAFARYDANDDNVITEGELVKRILQGDGNSRP